VTLLRPHAPRGADRGRRRRRNAAVNPARQAAVRKINGVLQSLLASANRYWLTLHHFSPPLRPGHANMVDRWLIAACDQAEKVMRRGENHQKRNQPDSDSEADFLRSLARGASPQGLKGIECEVTAIQQRYRKQIH
jgi:hypothetical protein